MAYTVGGAFDAFRRDFVDLKPADTSTARSSRNYLYSQLKELADRDATFPRLSNEFRPFGSFARRTKIRPLNDIDFLVVLDNRGTRETRASFWDSYTYRLEITDYTSPFGAFRGDDGLVSSIKILNKIRSSLSSAPNYGKAEIKRNMQAVTLKLLSYTWVSDIVPAVPIKSAFSTTVDHYLIPDGKGNWIRTDPRIDDSNATRLNGQHSSLFLPTVRILKYWNGRHTKPVLGSYYFETLALKVFDLNAFPVSFFGGHKITRFPPAVKYFFDRCPQHMEGSCPDPKGLGPALDAGLDSETRRKVSAVMSDASKIAGLALAYESQSQPSEAMTTWGRVFGASFPMYG